MSGVVSISGPGAEVALRGAEKPWRTLAEPGGRNNVDHEPHRALVDGLSQAVDLP